MKIAEVHRTINLCGYWRTDVPLRQQAMLTRHCAPIICFADFFSCSVRHSYWRRVCRCAIMLADCKEDERVLCASPIFKPIAYKLSISNRRRKFVEEKTTATLKFKQSSIATVLNHLLPVARFPTPPIFHYPLPLTLLFFRSFNFVQYLVSKPKTAFALCRSTMTCEWSRRENTYSTYMGSTTFRQTTTYITNKFHKFQISRLFLCD